MADFGDFVGDMPEPVVEAAVAVFEEAPAEDSNPFGEAPVAMLVAENGAGDEAIIETAPIDLGDGGGSAFFSDYTPPAPAPAPVQAEEPSENDPRILWGRKNAEVLKKKDEEEAEVKKKAAAKAKEFLASFLEARKVQMANRKTSNRSAEAAVKTEEVPKDGTTWEKVSALINFSSGVHHKDVSRYRSTLTTIKGRSIAV